MNLRSIILGLKQTYLSNKKTPLGRWKIHNDRETKLKIKYATEDNCGISYLKSKNITLQNIELNDNEYMYMMGYESVHK